MNHYSDRKIIEVLMIEDNPDDAFLTREALKETKLYINLNIIEDGVEAMAFLRREGRYAAAPRPDLVLLDLNLPKMDGREVLAQIKADINLKTIPVVVLTTSEAGKDIDKAYDLHANSYVNKPVDLDQFIRVVNSIEEFWLTIVKLPRRDKS